MKKFMDENFMLSGETAEKLYFDYAKDLPIFDFHCHLSPREIWENKRFSDITEVWLGGDHYKWRQMRTMGFDEKYITGNETSAKEKFISWAKTVPYLLGNPLYHWTHLEMQRYFGIDECLNEENAEAMWTRMNEMLGKDSFTPRGLIEASNVYAVCTTDDPADSLEYHQKIKEEGKMKTRIVPAMRPDKALHPEREEFSGYVNQLAAAAGMKIRSYQELKEALVSRIRFFDGMGCGASDHALEYVPFEPGTEQELEAVFAKAIQGEKLSVKEKDQYVTNLLVHLAKEYKRYNWAMEIHIGALRDNNQRAFDQLGPDTGFDAVNDYNYAPALAKLLSRMEEKDELPKMILFTLNPKDYYVLTTIMGAFQGKNTAAKIQSGSAWWFLDHKDGMKEQMKILASTGILAKFVGMVTDSRSFLSYPRHEYFRRILCDLLGEMVDQGEYPADLKMLGKIVEDICFYNAKNYIKVESAAERQEEIK